MTSRKQCLATSLQRSEYQPIHPLRPIRKIADEILNEMSPQFQNLPLQSLSSMQARMNLSE
jgi:hypothetical protein